MPLLDGTGDRGTNVQGEGGDVGIGVEAWEAKASVARPHAVDALHGLLP